MAQGSVDDLRTNATAPRARVGPTVYWVGLWATFFVTGVLSLIAYKDGLPFDEIFPNLDKAVHFSVGGALAFFLDGVLRRRGVRLGPIAVPLAALLVLVPAGIEEFLQRYSPNRTSSIFDFAADVAGVAFGVWLSRRLGR